MSLPTTVEMTQVLMYLTTYTKIGTPRHDTPKIRLDLSDRAPLQHTQTRREAEERP